MVDLFNRVDYCRRFMGDITPDPQEIWESIGGHFDNFTQLICEFVDNSLSNFRTKPKGKTVPNIIISLEEDNSNKKQPRVDVSIEDEGEGIHNFDDAMKLGKKNNTKKSTQLNEHGFGMKHALASANPENNHWRVCTRTNNDDSNGEFRILEAPYSFAIQETTAPIKDWTQTGYQFEPKSRTVVQFSCRRELFDTVQEGISGSAKFDTCINYLIEDLGFIYSIALFNQDFSITVNRNVVAPQMPDIKGHYSVSGQQKAWMGPVNLGGKGDIKISIQAVETTDKHLGRYYRHNTKCSGVEIRINGRIIEYNIFSEVFESTKGQALAAHNTYNHFLVMIDLISTDKELLPKTKTSKNGFQRGTPEFTKLLRWIKNTSPAPDKKPSNQTGERELTKMYAQKLDAVLQTQGKAYSVETEVECWSTLPKGKRPKIDMYVTQDADIIIYEMKKDYAGPIALFQLMMYWDGIVHDQGISPTKAYLISYTHATELKAIIAYLNASEDPIGNNYNFDIGTWKPLVNYPVP